MQPPSKPGICSMTRSPAAGFGKLPDLVANGSRVERKSLRRDIAYFQFGRQFGQRPLNAFQFDAEIADQVQRFEVEVAAEISD